jgi:hypothetical protein
MEKALENPTPHPLYRMLTHNEAFEIGQKKFIEAVNQREKWIQREQHDPLAFGWEPPIWKVVDALLGLPFVDAAWAERFRQHYGFEKPVSNIFLAGANSSAKTYYCLKRTNQILLQNPRSRAWLFHTSLQNSIDYHQSIIYSLLPPELRKKTLSQVLNISYTQKGGFSDNKFVLHNGAEGRFRSYEEDPRRLEGPGIDWIILDEDAPPDWIETLELRAAKAINGGKIINPCTPLHGYVANAKFYLDGSTVVQDSTAFMLPKDGGNPDIARELGLTDEELSRWVEANEKRKAASVVSARPVNVDEWLEGRSGQPEIPIGRSFERVPRIAKCAVPDRAVVWFHSADNPYGNPLNILKRTVGKPKSFVLERAYGVANKTVAARCPKFNKKVHVMNPDDIPKAGMNVLLMDPSSGRNFFMLWLRVTNEEPSRVIVYREWPGSYHIHEVGIPGPWALPDGKHEDGKKGPAQQPWGLGLWKYKREIARLEGWVSYKAGKAGADIRENEWVNGLEDGDSDENVAFRFIDSRAASAPKTENDRPSTLLTDFEEIGLSFELTPGDSIDEGMQKVNSALDYDEDSPVSYFNMPTLYVSSDCKNTIFSLETWTGAQGNKGACKDPMDMLRYFFLLDLSYMDKSNLGAVKRGRGR